MAVAGGTGNKVKAASDEDDDLESTKSGSGSDEDDDGDLVHAMFASPAFNPFKKGKAKNAYNSGTLLLACFVTITNYIYSVEGLHDASVWLTRSGTTNT